MVSGESVEPLRFHRARPDRRYAVARRPSGAQGGDPADGLASLAEGLGQMRSFRNYPA